MATSSTSADRATYRTVVLLRESDKLKLQRLASREKVSSAEVIRRFIRSGEEMLELRRDEEMIAAAMKIISEAVSEANQSLCRTIDKIDQLESDLHKQETA